jgi:hypothetical protein
VGGDVYPLPGAPELTLQAVTVDLAAKSVTAEVKASPGAAETTAIGSLSRFPIVHRNAFTGEIAFAAEPVSLSASLAAALNRTFAESRGKPPPFLAGESLGRINFNTETH